MMNKKITTCLGCRTMDRRRIHRQRNSKNHFGSLEIHNTYFSAKTRDKYVDPKNYIF